jgi:hypothetical protein
LAIRAKSGKETAFTFRMTWPRWTFTVISLIPMSYAICLFRWPVTRSTHHLVLAAGEGIEAGASKPGRDGQGNFFTVSYVTEHAEFDKYADLRPHYFGQPSPKSATVPRATVG